MTLVELYSGSPRVVLVHRNARERVALERAFVSRGWTVTPVESGSAALVAARDQGADAFVLGWPASTDPARLCARLAQHWTEVPVVVLGSAGGGTSALEVMRAGAFDWLPDVHDPEGAARTVGRALVHRGLLKCLQQRLPQAPADDPAAALIGTSAAMQQVRAWTRTIASSSGTVIITGETGTGKELAARTLHRCGARRDGPFVAVNCAAIPASLMESMLFGHARGAFTDARQARRGLLQQADGGTLLLDEIPHLPLSLQAKLLRALEARSARPVGSEREVSFDVRVLVAANRSLEAEVEAGRFRRDLYYRLAVFELRLPPLRGRGVDVLLLARHFLARSAERLDKPVVGLTPAAARRLLEHDWPGNVRELQNCIEAGVALARCDHLREHDLPRLAREHSVGAALEPFEVFPLDALENAYIEFVSKQVDGNKTMASRILGIDRKTLHRRAPPRDVPDERALQWIRSADARAVHRASGVAGGRALSTSG